ncbi:hypothetical protein BN2537_11935 [Streptomyces venezuelae]|nr:hypothetical protein BN2537_11935 [Streptomyces venezuelae]
MISSDQGRTFCAACRAPEAHAAERPVADILVALVSGKET